MDLDQDDEALAIAREGESGALTPARERTIIRHLPYFVTLAEDGNFNRASERLGLSQSALTRRIQTLEEELGILLFTRTHRSAKLTAAGQTLFEDSGRILQDLRSATRRAQLVSRGEAGDIHVALNDPAIRSPIVIAAFQALRRFLPGIKVHLHALPSEAQMIALRRKDIDLGFLFDVAIDKTNQRIMDSFAIGRSQSYLAMHISHPLASKPVIRLADLRDVELTWPSRRAGRPVSDGMIAAFRAAGQSPNIGMEVMGEDTTMNLAAANLGMGFVLDPPVTPPGVALRQVEDYQFATTLHAVWVRDEPHSGILRIVEELRQQVMARDAAGGAKSRIDGTDA